MMKSIFLCFLMSLMISGALAQDSGTSESNLAEDTKRDLIIISGAGLGGAILGLSTLSFVNEPSKHWKNVMVGGAVGIIVGVIVVASIQAERTGSYLEPTAMKDFDTTLRNSWHVASHQARDITSQNVPTMGWNFQF
ncbi:MAG: hypothetical protein JNM93_08020 [Bacteriovoracaceae bacterium]|nr:hypothetical protein [Bacteriovoracaceae bacterium]